MPALDEMYTQLRDRSLATIASDLGLSDETEVYGALMEMEMGGAVVTLVCFATGDASMYFSSGGGTIGGVGIPAVRAAAIRMVDLFGRHAETLHAVDSVNLPSEGKTSFVALTRSGPLVVTAPTDDIVAGIPVLIELFSAGQDVITAFRESSAGVTS